MLMEISMKDNGSMTRHTGMGPINTQTGLLMWENGLKISNTVRELKNGQMVQNMKDIIKMGKNMEMGA